MAGGRSASKVKNALTAMYTLGRALPDFFRARVALPQAVEDVRAAMARRAETFLDLARSEIYADPASPYLRLLRVAGCGYDDLRAQVLGNGLEAALASLARAGVYLTTEEFKGKKDVVRGGVSFRVSPAQLQRRRGTPGLMVQTSGTSDKPVTTVASLSRLEFHVPAMAVFF